MELTIVLLDSSCDLASFDCGDKTLNRYLKRHALKNQESSISKHYLAYDGDGVLIGFYAVSMTSISPDHLTLDTNMPRYNYPAGLVAQLAVDKRHQNNGYGEDLLMRAIETILEARKIVSCFAIVTDAKNLDAESFYLRYDFRILEPSKTTYPRRLYLLAQTYISESSKS